MAWRNPEQRRLYKRKWERDHYDSAKDRRRQYSRKYGITVEQYDALLAAQGGKCALFEVCGATKPGGRRNNWYVDHDHVTGKIRGLLCHNCNTYRVGVNDSKTIHILTRYLQT